MTVMTVYGRSRCVDILHIVDISYISPFLLLTATYRILCADILAVSAGEDPRGLRRADDPKMVFVVNHVEDGSREDCVAGGARGGAPLPAAAGARTRHRDALPVARDRVRSLTTCNM